jgi:hypothetical protein
VSTASKGCIDARAARQQPRHHLRLAKKNCRRQRMMSRERRRRVFLFALRNRRIEPGPALKRPGQLLDAPGGCAADEFLLGIVVLTRQSRPPVIRGTRSSTYLRSFMEGCEFMRKTVVRFFPVPTALKPERAFAPDSQLTAIVITSHTFLASSADVTA